MESERINENYAVRSADTGPELDDFSDSSVSSYHKFDDMELSTDLLRGIYSYGFEEPSVIQQLAIVPFKEGKDVIAQAQSGTGKTGAFTVGILSRISMDQLSLQALILAPTRELADQINEVIKGMGVGLGVKTRTCVGGRRASEDAKAIRQGVHIIVGTPGRIIDLLKRGDLRCNDLKCLVLDEADEMLSLGFQEDIRTIFKYLPDVIQVGIFSATLPPEALEITTKFMEKPVRILVKQEELTLDGIVQFYVDCQRDEWKYSVLKELYEHLSINQAVIFCNSRKRVDRLREDLERDNFTVSSTHGAMTSEERRDIMRKFREGGARVLIATDLLSRGIDVQQVSIVINYDLPKNKESYIHRVGRSARFGRKGMAINFVTKRDIQDLQDLEKYYDIHVDPMPENVKDFI